MSDNTFKQNTFVLKEDGKIVWIEKMPEVPSLLDCQNIHFGKPDSDSGRMLQKLAYKQALQSAIANGIEVENHKEVIAALKYHHLDKSRKPLEEGKLYPLQCRVEVVYSGDVFVNSKESGYVDAPKALVTFPEDKPEQKKRPAGIEHKQGQVNIYIKKPIEVEAIQFTEECKDRVYQWAKDIQMNVSHGWDENQKPVLNIPTLEGEMICAIGDYLIKEPFPTDWRRIYPCKQSIFENTYLSKPEQKEETRACNHDALIDTGVGYDVCPMCNSSFPHEEPEAAGQEQEAVDHANRILFSNLKYQIGNIFTEKFLEHNDGKFHTALELNPAIHAVTEFVFEKIKQQKP